jgi:C1A family cysteine protease
MSTQPKHKYSWKRDPNYHTIGRKHTLKSLPLPAVTPDLSAVYNIGAYDQGQLGSCTANAWAFLVEYDEFKENLASPCCPSRLGIYYCERVIDGDVSQDGGSTLSTGQKVIQTYGAASERLWPYDITKFTAKPPTAYYTAAAKSKGVQFMQVHQTIDDIKNALCSGYPVACGFNVYQEFENQTVVDTGIVPNPTPGEQPIGGHAIVIVQLDDTKKMALIRNSWGTSWGANNSANQRGYFWITYDYLLSQDWSDFWICQRINDPAPAPTPSPQPTPTPSPPQPGPVPGKLLVGHLVPYNDSVLGQGWITLYIQK